MLDGLIAPGTQLLLIRHGETQWNLDQRIQGQLDVELTDRGVEQARRLAARLREEPLHAVYASDLRRAARTAELVAGERIPVRPEPRVREASFGRFEGLTTREIEERYPEAYRLWRADSLAHRPPGGETIEELQSRCIDALRAHLPAHAGETVAFVAHGGPVRVLVCGLLGLPLAVYPRLRVENASVSRILFTERGAVLAGFNETAHLRASGAIPRHAGWEEK